MPKVIVGFSFDTERDKEILRKIKAEKDRGNQSAYIRNLVNNDLLKDKCNMKEVFIEVLEEFFYNKDFIALAPKPNKKTNIIEKDKKGILGIMGEDDD